MAVQLPKVGEVFLDRYAVERVVGFGGYGRIYQARQTDLGRSVALKIIAPPSESSDEDSPTNNFAERFTREAMAISQLSDPHTVTMYDHGEHDGLLYMVLEYIEGQTLKEAVLDGAMPAERVVAILRQVLQSLAEAHEAKLIHRDIKPTNIMIFTHMSKRDRVKVLDFGLAKSIQGEQLISAQDLTAADTLVGTPRYMSPEQVRHEPITPATDLYSLGLVAIEMLTGEAVIKEQTAMSIVARHVSEKEYDLDALDCPAGLRNVIARMVCKNPAGRYQSADENLEALDGWQDTEVAPANRRLVPVVAVVASLLMLAVVVAMAWPSDAPRPPKTTSPTLAVPVEPPEPIVDEPVIEVDEPPPADLRPMYEAVVGARVRVNVAHGASLRAADETKPAPTRKRRRKTKKIKKTNTGRDLKIFEP